LQLPFHANPEIASINYVRPKEDWEHMIHFTSWQLDMKILILLSGSCCPLEVHAFLSKSVNVFSFKMEPMVHNRSDFVLFEFKFAL
jgi:hypothetical protein